MIKWIKIFIAFWVTSFFYFPVTFFAFPSMNTKTAMAAVGLVFCAYTLFMKKEKTIPENLVTLSFFAIVVSLIGMVSMTINSTIDDAYSGYVTSMAVWLSAAYVVCSMIRNGHGRISVDLICDYIIAVCVMQCVCTMLIDNSPSFKSFFDSYVNMDQKLMEEDQRLYGFGAALDVAGTRFSACLIMIVAVVLKHKDSMSVLGLLYYVFAFIVITVVGSMIARTTYVGVGLSVLYALVTMDYSASVTTRTVGKLAVILFMVVVAIAVCTFFYNADPNFRHLTRFAFEGFFNFFERGDYYVSSTETLKSMYVYPDNPKTWIIGDGYFSNPYWSDWTYTYIHQNMRGFYKGTDVGYLRFIFYFGVIGLSAFCIFMCKAAQICAAKCRKFTAMFVFILLANFAIWFKVATDLFLVFALFICTVNMMDEGDCDASMEKIR